MHKFETYASDDATIIIGPEGYVVNVSIGCYFKSNPCLKNLSDMMTAYGFDLVLVDQAIEEYNASNLKSWYKWYKSSDVAVRIDKNPQSITLVAMDREYSKKQKQRTTAP